MKVAPKVLYLDGTLGRGLAAVQDDRALAADEFITAMNGGIAAIGDGLVRIAEHVTEADVRGRDGIMRMFAGGH